MVVQRTLRMSHRLHLGDLVLVVGGDVDVGLVSKSITILVCT